VGIVLSPFHLLPSESVGLLGALREFLLHGEDDLQGHRADGFHQQFTGSAVERGPGDLLALPDFTLLGLEPPAAVDGHLPSASGLVADAHRLTATAADEQSLQQRRTLTGWALPPL